jgi:hypothetical protein
MGKFQYQICNPREGRGDINSSARISEYYVELFTVLPFETKNYLLMLYVLHSVSLSNLWYSPFEDIEIQNRTQF